MEEPQQSQEEGVLWLSKLREIYARYLDHTGNLVTSNDIRESSGSNLAAKTPLREVFW